MRAVIYDYNQSEILSDRDDSEHLGKHSVAEGRKEEKVTV